VQTSALPIKICLRLILVLAASISLNGWCQQDAGQDPNIYERIWAVPVLYQNTDNPTLQSFSLIGRYHGQYWNVNADQGDANDWENRRKIVGFSSKWFQDFTVQAQMFLKTNGGSLYGGLYEGFIKWAPAGTDFSLSVGRLDYLFTGFERSKSSKKINVIERGLLVNQIMPAEVVGAHLKGKIGRFSYHAGWFSSSIEQEFDDFKSGSAGVIGGSYDTPLFYKEGSLHLDYLHNSGKSEDNAFRPYRNVVSLWHRGESGRLGMGVDLTYAEPLETAGHVFGLTIEPTWMLLNEVFGSNDPLQLAVRYQYASSTEDNGLSLQRRYEQEVTQGNGDRYQAIYTGLNYYLYGQKLKLMAGGEYAQMKDAAGDGGKYSGWTWFGAIRLYF
jgi:phosphate-selective porin OprO/OprP